MIWTNRRTAAALLWAISAVSAVLLAVDPNFIYAWLLGFASGAALLATLLCWKWGL